MCHHVIIVHGSKKFKSIINNGTCICHDETLKITLHCTITLQYMLLNCFNQDDQILDRHTM
jgi:hypothetical protein